MTDITEEELESLFEDDDIAGSLIGDVGCEVFEGLKIINKYIPNKGITGAGHDVIYSVSVEDIINSGLTSDDALMLAKLNWMSNEGCLACFV